MCKETSRIRRSRSRATSSTNSVQVTPQMCVNPRANTRMGRRLWRVFFAAFGSLLSLVLFAGSLTAQVSMRIDHIDTARWVEESTIRFFVDLLDHDNRVIPNLQPNDIEVYVGEASKPLTGSVRVRQFREIPDGVAVAILMAAHNAYVPHLMDDGAGESALPEVFELQKLGVRQFIGKLEEGDRVAIFMYDQATLTTIDSFSSNFRQADDAVERNARVRPPVLDDGGRRPQLHAPNLVRNLTNIIENRFADEVDLPRRRILLLMSDGLDRSSGNPQRLERQIADLCERAQDYDIAVFAIGFSLGDQSNLRYLREISTRTGGAYREIDYEDASRIPDVFSDIGDEIKRQYVIDFTSDELRGGQSHRFRLMADTMGRTVPAIYDRSVRLAEKPFDWGRLLLVIGLLVGCLLAFFLIFKIVKWIANRPAPVEEYEEYTGPSRGRLTILKGPHAGEEHHLVADLTTIGSMPGNDICLGDDSAVSKRHAGIKIDDMRYELADFGSTNHTFVNGRKINKQFLRDGDVIRVGDTEVSFNLK